MIGENAPSMKLGSIPHSKHTGLRNLAKFEEVVRIIYAHDRGIIPVQMSRRRGHGLSFIATGASIRRKHYAAVASLFRD